eukprot:evm.model.scf_578.1 EVM.evm.TU.scf_578.1   scf_578:10448-18674(-)
MSQQQTMGDRTDTEAAEGSGIMQAIEWSEDRSKTVRKGGFTPNYVAPEVLNGKPVCPESDTFSFGVVIHEVLSGEKPYSSSTNVLNLYAMILAGKPPCPMPADCPDELAAGGIPPLALLQPQMEYGERGPVRQDVQVTFMGLVLTDVDQLKFVSIRLLDLFSKMTSWVKSGYDAVVDLLEPFSGSVIFPFQIEYPSRHCAAFFKREAENVAAFVFQTDLELLAFQPQAQVTISEDVYVADTQVAKLEAQVQSIIEDIVGAADVMYSRNMIHFLQGQIADLKSCTFHLPMGAQEEVWNKSLAVLLHHLKHAQQIIRLHSFVDVHVLYRTPDTEMIVKRTIRAINDFLVKWNLGTAGSLLLPLPSEHAKQDSRCLVEHLGYVFKDLPCSFEGDSKAARREWETAKDTIADKRRKLPVITKKNIMLGHPIAKNVHSAKWRERSVAVKQIVASSEDDIGLEEFAKFYTRTFSQTVLDPQSVVNVYGVTTGGAVVVQLADSDLMQWYTSLSTCYGKDTVSQKLSVLARAAGALKSLHAAGIVHGCVKSSNFLFFGQDVNDCVIKISELQVPIEPWERGRGAVAQAVQWMAKEVCDGQPHSMKSDVFAFGAMMWEVATQVLPYRQGTSAMDALRTKLAGEMPCAVSRELEKTWPLEVLDVMRACCSPCPEDRPSMEDVWTCMEKWNKGQVESFSSGRPKQESQQTCGQKPREERLAAYEVRDSNTVIHDTSEKVDALPEKVAAA